MAKRKHPFEIGYSYHIYNRGVEKRDIFMNLEDYSRFVYLMEVCNSTEFVPRNRKRYFQKRKGKYKTIKNVHGKAMHIIEVDDNSKRGERLVEITNWCLMPNHFHFCLKQLEDGGISKFLLKLLSGYTKYFNIKYDRSGVLMQGKTKSRFVDSDNYYRYLQYYIDFNPLDIFQSGWKDDGIRDVSESKFFLEEYLWSKRKDYSKYNFVFNDFSREYIQDIDEKVQKDLK